MAYRAPVGPSHPGPPAAPATRICRACGVVAPVRGTACETCKRPLAETAVQVAMPAPDLFWVAVRSGFTCNSCKFLAPLDGLDADGAVECAHCGLRQRFEPGLWRTGLDFAHAVGDLAGPDPEGRYPHPSLWIGSENPHALVGETQTFAHATTQAQATLAVDAAPGHPVCRKCHVPVAVALPAPGTCETMCSRCGDRARYVLPDSSRNVSPVVVCAVADNHRTDRPRAATSPTQVGAVALVCPSCGGPLQIAADADRGGVGSRVHACTFCKAMCIVPHRSAMRARNVSPDPDVWWILFRGASGKRAELLAPLDAPKAESAGAKKLLFASPSTAPIGEAPGVYEAPEVAGTYWPQVLLTLVAGGAALAIAGVLYALAAGLF